MENANPQGQSSDIKRINAALRAAIVERLVAHGWTRSDGAALAVKAYPTAVGDKEAWVYLQDFGPEDENVILAGDYQSEGRNQLESYGVLIPRKADVNEVVRLVDKFVTDADVRVGETYAARLLKNWPQPTN